MAHPGSPVLSDQQIATLAEHGEERTAAVGETLFEAGDERFPFIAILEGEAAVESAAGHEIIRHGASGFVGEMSLLTGQTAFLSAVVTKPMRYIAVDREALRPLLLEDGPLADVVLSNFMRRREALQGLEGVGIEIVGPRSSASTRRLVEFARRTPKLVGRSTPSSRFSCHSSGSPEGPSCTTRAMASCRERSTLASRSQDARRST